jgi:drug/metabolite transporter (DMT)-like permease
MILLAVIVLIVAVSACLFAAMFRRDNPMHGLTGLGFVLVAGVLAVLYGILDRPVNARSHSTKVVGS